jgi:hypothetical protein
MKRLPNVSLLGLGFALANLLLTFFVWQSRFEGSWGGFLLFILNFPVSMLSFIPLGWNQWAFFLIFGPIWWYSIGFVAERIWVSRRKLRKSHLPTV